MKPAAEVAKDFLREVSSDDSWIDGSSEHVLWQLIALILEERANGVALALKRCP